MSIIDRLFNTGAPKIEQSADDKRADGYSSYNAQVICAFQRDLETLGCDYSALQDTLQFARSINDYKVTPIGLMAHYTEQTAWMFADRK